MYCRPWLVLAPVLVVGSIALAAADPTASAKVDIELDNPAEIYPVFVRMTDQLIAGAGDHERFCRDHATVRRRELRAEVIRTLHEKADRSWEKIGAILAPLVQAGKVRDVERCWIINGFFCLASGSACRELGALADVGFVYRERGPLHQQKQTRPLTDPAIAARQQTILRQVSDGWRDDSDDPLDLGGVEISWNLKTIGADAAWTSEKATGRGIVIAMMDSGMMIAPALTRALWKNPK